VHLVELKKILETMQENVIALNIISKISQTGLNGVSLWLHCIIKSLHTKLNQLHQYHVWRSGDGATCK